MSTFINSFWQKAAPFITMSSNSVSSSWSPTQITNGGSTLEWTVSNGVNIAKTTVDDPTFDFSGNTGTADIRVEKIDGLTDLFIDNLSLTELDVSANTVLTDLFCYSNLIVSLDVSNNTALINLYCSNNLIVSLDVSTNTELINLFCYNNEQEPPITDQIYNDLDANGKSNGSLAIRNNRTSASDTARANLITKGWSINDTFTT